MIYNSVAEIFEAMDETRERVSSKVGGLTPTQAEFRATPEAWSIAQIVEHLSIMEDRLSRLFTMMVKKTESAGAPAREGQSFRPVSLEHIVERSLKEKYNAPEVVHPSGDVPVQDSLARMRRSREALRELRPKLETIDLSGATYPHPAFGPLDLYQWLVMIGMHEDRHLRQIESIMSSPEFKAAVAVRQ
jgi:DinB superfamily